MLEPAGTPTFFGMTGAEWHALLYGLKDGFKFWKRTHMLYSDIDKLDVSPEIKQELKDKFHYYEIGSDLPEDVLLLVGLIYMVGTGQAEGIFKIAINMALSQVGMSI